ncbi:MAG: single-stranded DNA-binding protein [Lachnospiraceae bacterium]|uniref:single-stranded DNA-binding protein n=1 Tax=uncultured Rikenella sp. TaxID=368003 RepID=UPI00261F52DF|nr:single-stranded DNA-binding protein [uncultured Rikenella sp.]MCX4322286.1 single-stranded DNA-binding protein [Lachnospiraceae bacterium]
MNKVILMGRLTRDPEVRYSQGAEPMAVARYTLAVDRRGRRDENGQNADFISCVAFARNAEFAEKYFRKGTKIAITGRIQTGSYNDREGRKVYTTDVVIEDQEFAESKSSQNGGNTQAPPEQSDAGDGFMNIPDGIDEELPFN